jgi:hypothetical protein
MQTNWAEENLQTIRTLMERSTLYRRALAPIVLFAGIMGVLAAAAGLIFHLDSSLEFGGLWLGTAMVVVIGAFFNTRRQAIKDGEALWSPPTRRVAQALLPPLTAGFIFAVLSFRGGNPDTFLPLLWAIFYGCALHSAGFFVARGLKWFGWIYIVTACGILTYNQFGYAPAALDLNPHLLMGFFFGVLHLVCGAYLYLTEKGKNAA